MGVIDKLYAAKKELDNTVFPEGTVGYLTRMAVVLTKEDLDEFFEKFVTGIDPVTKLECTWITEFNVSDDYIESRMAQELAKQIKPEIIVHYRNKDFYSGLYGDRIEYKGSILVPTKYVKENKGE